jgi:hypothetical protein
VRADTAIPITVERSRIAAVPAVTLAGDEIDERRFLGEYTGSIRRSQGVNSSDWLEITA